MKTGIHPIMKKTYLLDNKNKIHITNTSILTKYITFDYLRANTNILEDYRKSNRKNNVITTNTKHG